jgi:hypothetical protein
MSLLFKWQRALVLTVVISAAPLLVARSKFLSNNAAADRDYPAALAAANRFLHAWQERDHETGILMLTDEAKQHISEALLEDFFSPEAASRRAYEIVRGKKLSGSRYAFPVALFEAPGKARSAPRYSQIIIVKDGQAEWSVDKMP